MGRYVFKLPDVGEGTAEKGKAYSQRLLDHAVKKGRSTHDKRDALLAKMNVTPPKEPQYLLKPPNTYLDPGSLGCIGVGTPFGIAASLVRPDQTVVVATGDGAFGFNAMEIDTAVRQRAPVLVVVANNGSWAIEVRDQQETHGKVVGTHLQFADHAAMARAFGMHAERITRADELPGGIARALAEPYIVQRRIALPSEPFPAIHDGALQLDDRIVDTAPFCWHGAWMDGCLTRISTSTLVNVTAGGGSTIPTFVVEPR